MHENMGLRSGTDRQLHRTQQPRCRGCNGAHVGRTGRPARSAIVKSPRGDVGARACRMRAAEVLMQALGASGGADTVNPATPAEMEALSKRLGGSIPDELRELL